MIRNLEVSVLSPTLYDWFMLEQQFRPDDDMIEIAGMPTFANPTEGLTLDWNLRWLVGSQVPPLISQIKGQELAQQNSPPPPAQGAFPQPSPTGTPSQGVGPQAGGVPTF
jgi:hypothetical protein